MIDFFINSQNQPKMKRKFTTFVLLMCMVLPIFGQNPAIDFSVLNNPNWIPSGRLFENNPEFWTLNPNHHPAHFNGHTDSVCNRDKFLALYHFFYNASFSTPTAAQPIIPSALEDDVRQTGMSPPVRLGLMDFSYQVLSDSALGAGIIAWDSTDFVAYIVDSLHIQETIYEIDTTVIPHDTLGSLYVDSVIFYDKDSLMDLAIETHELLAMAAFNPMVILDSADQPLTLLLESIYYFRDQSANYQLSVDGGVTFHSIIPNTALTIQNHNLGSGNHEIILRKGPLSDSPKSIFELTIAIRHDVEDYQIEVFDEIQCPDLDFSDGVGEGVASFFINDINNGLLTKPVIIVEGLEYYLPSDEINDVTSPFSGGKKYYGINNAATFTGEVPVQAGKFYYPMSNSLYLYDSLVELGYDVIYLDFKTNRTNLRKNANYLIQLIQYVNMALEQNNSPEQIAILGLGSGGVVSRIALREMELQYCCHNTRMHTTFDSPHRGINIPLGLQMFMDDTRDIFKFRMERNKPVRLFYENIVLSPAFSELLIYNIDPWRQNIRTTFQQYLDEIGMPQGTRNFAITNGNHGGFLQHINDVNQNVIATGNQIFDFEVKFLAITALKVDVSFFNKLLNLTGTNWYIARAIPLIGGHVAAVDQLEVYHRGPYAWLNTLSLITHYGIAIGGIKLIKGIKATTLVLAAVALAFFGPIAGPISAALIKKAGAIAVAVTTTATIAALYGSVSLNNSLNDGSNLNKEKNPFPMLDYDRAPGGRFDIPGYLGKRTDDGLGTIKRPFHNFVAAVSALNIDTTALAMDISDAFQNSDPSKWLPFEDYHSAISANTSDFNNEYHTLFTIGTLEIPGNLPWFLERLESTYNVSTPSSQDVIVLQGETMNYGVPDEMSFAPEKKLRNMDILAHGKAAVNSLDNVGIPTQLFDPPKSGSNFSITTQSPECGGTYCKVDNLGIFQIGEYVSASPAFSTTGQAIFLENSTLEILPGGKLIIERNSRLVIEEGATLIIHPGAEIYLNDGTAILEIKGKVKVEDNATFTFTSVEDGNYGRIIINQRWEDNHGNPISRNEYWDIGSNTHFVLEGSNQHGDIMMECKEHFAPQMDDYTTFASMTIKNGTVDMHDYTLLNISCPLDFQNTRIRLSAEGTHAHLGVQLWAQTFPSTVINNNQFYDGLNGLRCFQMNQQDNIRIENCLFENNTMALYVEEGRFRVNNSTFTNNQTGINTIDTRGSCRVSGTTFTNVEQGIEAYANLSADLIVSSCAFDNTSFGGPQGKAITHHFPLQMACTSIRGFEYGTDTWHTRLNMQSDAYNSFASNEIAVHFTEIDELFLGHGKNLFFDSNITDIEGSLNANATANLYMGTHVYADENDMFTSGGGQFNTDIVDVSQSPVQLYNPNPFVLEIGCIEDDPGMNMLSNPYGSGGIKSFGANNKLTSLESNLIQTAAAVNDPAFDQKDITKVLADLVSTLDDVMLDVRSIRSTANTRRLARNSILMVWDVLRKAYTWEELPLAGADPLFAVNEPMDSLASYIDDMINTLNPLDSLYADNKAELELMQAHLYRLGQHHVQASMVLQSISTAETSQRNTRVVMYWRCIVDWEIDVLQGNINPQQAYEDKEQCQLYNPYTHPVSKREVRENSADESNYGEGTLSFFPNPTSDNIYVRMEDIAHPEDEVELTVTSMDGRVLLRRTQEASYMIGINVEKFKQGAYILTVSTPYKKQNGQFLIVR